jgi:hypothetical protein
MIDFDEIKDLFDQAQELCVVNEMLWPFLSEYERTVPI